MERCLRPHYAEKFRCNGGFCKSYCCHDWRIVIDDMTMAKYRAMPDKLAREQILAQTMTQDGRHYAKLREGGACSFLREDGLCCLQRDYGADFLADVCCEYPRVTNRLTEDYWEQSLTITCPVAAHLVLENPAPIEFIETEAVVCRENFANDMRGKGLLPLAKTLDVQGVCIAILQDRRFAMDERLFLLSLFGEELDKQTTEAAMTEFLSETALAKFLAASVERMKDAAFKPREYVAYNVALFASVYDALRGEGAFAAIATLFAEYYEVFFNDVLTDKRYLWENYAVNKFFMTLCPWTNEGNFSRNLRLFAAGYKLTEFATFVTAVKTGGVMTTAEIINIMTHVSEQLDHNREAGNALRAFVGERTMTEREFREAMFLVVR